jgi:hypothetical protein
LGICYFGALGLASMDGDRGMGWRMNWMDWNGMSTYTQGKAKVAFVVVR